MIKKYFILLLSVFFVHNVFAQDIEYYNDFKSSLKKDIQSDFTKIESDLKEAENYHKQAGNALSSTDTSGSLKYFQKASDIFSDGYRTVFLAFKDGLNTLSPGLDGEKKQYADYMIFLADDYFRKSIANRFYAEKSKDDSQALKLYAQAHSNEYEAVNTQVHTFAVITGRITEDLSIPEIDYTEKEIFDNSVTENFDNHNFMIEGVDMPEHFNYESTDIVYVDADENSNHSSNNGTQSDNDYTDKGSDYRIQIGTSIIPANESQINRLHSTDMKVRTFKSDLYFKYTIGSFNSFQDAKNFKNAYGLANTYVVKYENGKEVKLYLRDFQ